MYDPDRPNSSQRSSQHTKDDYRKEGRRYPLPSNGFRFSTITGLIGALFVFCFPFVIAFLAASSSRHAPGQIMPLQIATFIFGWGVCGSAIVVMFLAFLVGIIVGKFAVKRELGIWAGILVGIALPLSYIIGAYLPGNPNNTGSSTITATSLAAMGPGLLVDAILIGIFALLGGSISFLGACTTTFRHPYYRSRQ